MSEITTEKYIDDKIKLHNLYAINDILNRMSETVDFSIDELENDFDECDALNDSAIAKITDMIQFNINKIEDYLCELGCTIKM